MALAPIASLVTVTLTAITGKTPKSSDEPLWAVGQAPQRPWRAQYVSGSGEFTSWPSMVEPLNTLPLDRRFGSSPG